MHLFLPLRPPLLAGSLVAAGKALGPLGSTGSSSYSLASQRAHLPTHQCQTQSTPSCPPRHSLLSTPPLLSDISLPSKSLHLCHVTLSLLQASVHTPFLLPGSPSPGWNDVHPCPPPWAKGEMPPPSSWFFTQLRTFLYWMFSFSNVVNACKEQKDYTDVYVCKERESLSPESYSPEITMLNRMGQTFFCEFTTYIPTHT